MSLREVLHAFNAIESRLTIEPYVCRECGHMGQAVKTITNDWVPHGDRIVPMPSESLTCGGCASEDIEELEDRE